MTKVKADPSESRTIVSNTTCYRNQPTTRRTLLARGIIQGIGFVSFPSLVQLIYQRQAYGAPLKPENMLNCKAPASANVVPGFLQIELVGGWGAARNFAFGKQQSGGAYDPLAPESYATLGLGTMAAPTQAARMDTSMGGPFVVGSDFLRGLISVTTPEARAKISVAGQAGISVDDGTGLQSNQHNISQAALQVAGAGGQLVQLVGNGAVTNTLGATRALDIGDDAGISKARVNAPGDVANLVDPGLLAKNLSADAVQRISKGIQRMSEAQLERFDQKTLPEQVSDLVRCGYIGSKDLLGGISIDTLNPTNDPAVTSVPTIQLTQNQDDARTATVAKMLADGNSAAGTLTLGGYDYHGDGLATQNAQDFRAGRQVGIALQIAHSKNRPLFILVTSNGSVAAPADRAPDSTTNRIEFASDSGERGASLLFAISAQANTKPQTNHFQIGSFSNAGAVSVNYLAAMANNPRVQSIVALANYAAFAGRMDAFRKFLAKYNEPDIVGDSIDYLAFKPV
jgi:hypothetical protein